MSAVVTFFTEPFGFEFMRVAFTAAVIAAVTCGLLSCWLVLIGWSLMGDAVSHAVLPGVVIAYILGAPFAVGALAFGLLAVALIGLVHGTSRIKEDAAIGIVFTTLFAIGLILISTTPSDTDLTHIVFGNPLGVSDAELTQMAVLGALTVVVLVTWRHDFTLFAFDAAHAFAIGLRPRLARAVLLGLLALTAVVGLQVVGVILVVALLIIPGATAQLLTERFSVMLVIAPVLSAVCAVTGLYISYYADVSPGGSIVATQGAVFAVVYLRALLGSRFTGARPRARRSAA